MFPLKFRGFPLNLLRVFVFCFLIDLLPSSIHYWKWAIDGNSCKVGTSSKLLIQSEYPLYILSLYPETVAFPVVSGKYLVCFRWLLEIAYFLWNVINRTGSKTFNLRNSRSLMRRQKQYWKWRELMRLYTGCRILICYHYRRYTNDFIFFAYDINK